MSKKFSNVNLNSLAKGRAPASNPSQRATARSLNPSRGLVSLGPSKPAAVKKPTTSAWGQPKEEPEPAPEEKVEESYHAETSCDRPPEEVPETPEFTVESLQKASSLSWADASEVWEDRDEWLLRTKSVSKPAHAPAIQEEDENEPSISAERHGASDGDKNWRRNVSATHHTGGAHSSSVRPQVQLQPRPAHPSYSYPPSQVSVPPPPSLPPPGHPLQYQLESPQYHIQRQEHTEVREYGAAAKSDIEVKAGDIGKSSGKRADKGKRKLGKTDEEGAKDADKQPIPQRSPQNQRLQLEYQRHLDQARGIIPKGGSMEGTPREFEVQDVPSTALVMNLSSVLKRLHGSCSMQQLIKALPSLKEQGVCIESFLHSHSHVFELKGRIVYLKTPEESWEAEGHGENWQQGDWQDETSGWQQDEWQDEPAEWKSHDRDAPPQNNHSQETRPKKSRNGRRNEWLKENKAQDGRRKRNGGKNVMEDGGYVDGNTESLRRTDRGNRQETTEKDWNAGKENAPSQRGRRNKTAQPQSEPQPQQQVPQRQDGPKKKAKPSRTDDNWRQPIASETGQTQQGQEQPTTTRSQRSRRNKKTDSNNWAEDWNGWNENDWWGSNAGGGGERGKKRR